MAGRSTALRAIAAGIPLVLLLLLAWVIRLAWINQPVNGSPVAIATPVATPVTATLTPTVTAAPTVELGNVQRLTEAGFAFRQLANYTSEVVGNQVTLTAGDEGNLAGSFQLSGGHSAQIAKSETVTTSKALFTQLVTRYAQEHQLQAQKPYTISVGGYAGQAVDFTSQVSTEPLAGRLAFVQPQSDQFFVLTGQAPLQQWQQGMDGQFDALLASVTLFTLPSVSSALPTATPDGESLEATPSLLSTPTPAVTRSVAALSAPAPGRASPWQSYSNANLANDLVVAGNTIWVASDGGVVAWNKNTNTSVKFTTLDGLAANRTTSVVNCPLRGFGLVFGSERGLQIFDPQSGNWKVLNTANSSMSFDDVATLYCDVINGFLVVGYKQHGLDLFDVAVGNWSYIDEQRGLQNSFVEAITVVGKRAAIWVSSGFGISVIPKQGTPQFYNDSNSALETNQVYRMVADSTGAVWLGAQNALYKVVNNDWTVYDQTFVLASRFPAGAFTGLAMAKDGTLWLGSDKGEICHFDPVKVQCLEFFAGIEGMAVGTLTSLSIGPDGNVYFATAGGGISMYDGQQWRTYALPNERLAGNQVRDLIQDRAGQIWVASEAGIQQLSLAGETTTQLFTAEKDNLSTSETEVLHPAPKSGIWLGAVGASYFNGLTWTNYTNADGLAGNLVQAIATDSQGRTWFGTEFGLSIWNGSAFFNLNRENGLPSDNISALVADGDTMWIGTKGGGLLRFEKNQIRLFDAAKVGLPSDTVTALAQAADGALWVGTSNGLAKFLDGAATPVPALAGLVITAIAAGSNGPIWVGTQDDGLFYFDGKDWVQPPGAIKPPAQHITAILIDQQGAVWVGSRSGGVIRYKP